MDFFSLLFFLFLGAVADDHPDSFVDKFDTWDDSRWKKENGSMYCPGHCMWLDDGSVQRLEHLGAGGKVLAELQFTMTNDCKEGECCENGMCVPWRTGSLVSQQAYTFGSFRFVSVAANHPFHLEEYDSAIWTCYGTGFPTYIESSDEAKEFQGFSICVLSENPYYVVALMVVDGVLYDHHVQLHFNAAKTVAVYRIDWFPDQVNYYIDKHLVWTTENSGIPANVSVPNKPLHITTQLTHVNLQDSNNTEGVRFDMKKYPPMQHTMHLYRMRYLRWNLEDYHADMQEVPTMGNPNDDESANSDETTQNTEKTELLVLRESHSFRVEILLVSMFLIAMCIFAYFLKNRKHLNPSELSAHYTKLQDSEDVYISAEAQQHTEPNSLQQ